MWKTGIILAYLLVLSLWDIRECRVPVVLLTAGSAFAGIVMGYELLAGETRLLEFVLGSCVGLLLLLVAWFSRKAGYADGIILLWLGGLYGYRQGLLILCVSLMLISLTSVALFLLGKVKRHTRIPYIPFITIGFVTANCMC